jgi:SAM-dependent methyltransferase
VSRVLRVISQLFGSQSQHQPPKIDVKQLIAELDDSELLAAADGYFHGLDIDSEQCHKPFSNVADAIHITRNLSLLFQAADLFRGADVLDFGCATGWLSLALANLGCNVVGVDVAPSALRLAEALCEKRGVRSGGAVRFAVYDGLKLPLEDSSVDRIVCFDAFHHVKSQQATLSEFARVLRPGGRIAMLEPGPFHSQTAQSQAEMSKYNVIENDIVVADIAAAATKIGLAAPQMLVQLQEPMLLSLDQYLQWSVRVPKSEGEQLLARIHRQFTDTQCFFLLKPGQAGGVDSRRPDALSAVIELVSVNTTPDSLNAIALKFRILNTGQAIWISSQGAVGVVNLGCQLIGPDKTVKKVDFLRFSLGGTPILPGTSTELTISLLLPDDRTCGFQFDLVAEQIAWFSQLGRCEPTVCWAEDLYRIRDAAKTR